MGDTARMNDRGANEVDQLLGDQGLAVVDGVEYFADRDRRHRVLADEPEAFLVLRWRRILHPEQPVRLERFAQPAGLDRRETVVHVVENMVIEAEARADGVEQPRRMIQIIRGRPDVFGRNRGVRRLVIQSVLSYAGGWGEPRHTR